MNKIKLLTLSLAVALMTFTSCGGGGEKPSQNKQATATEELKENVVVEGSKMNAFFPKDGDGYDVVFTQEKTGFSQAELRKDGKAVAFLSVSDVANNKAAANGYASASDKVAGFPAVAKGSKGTAVLVADKFQVQARSIGDGLDENQRKAWIEKFDLNGLSQLKK